MKLIINKEYAFSKVGLSEVQGLKPVLIKLMKPIRDALKERIYWSEVDINETEYKSRDGFIPYSHNCGGVEICQVIPECERYDFSYLNFGEWDGTHCCDGTDTEHCECMYASDGEYDAKLRIWFKFEGIERGRMQFYLVLAGGNGDAPYFRTKYEETIIETEFTARNFDELKRVGAKHIQKLLKIIKG